MIKSMKKELVFLAAMVMPFLLCQCDNTQKEKVDTDLKKEAAKFEQQRIAEINQENKIAWDEAKAIKLSDLDFLQTKEPMSDNAIAPYDYHTGLVGDKAYNNVVYMKALERAKKKLQVKDGLLFLTVKSGKEINIAEDLFQFIVALIDEWNQFVKDGKFEIIQTEEGYYDISPIISDHAQTMASPVDLMPMSASQRWEAVKRVIDASPNGTYIHEHFLLNFNTGTLHGEYRDGSKRKRYSVSDGCGTWGNMDPNCHYNYIASIVDVNDALFYIYSMRNSNHQSLASYQIEK